jgi:hypothetical protein
MEENNEEKTTITENIADDTDVQDEKIVAEMVDTLERPVVQNKTRKPRSEAQVKAFAKARAALNQKKQMDREKKLAEKKPVGRPRNKKIEKVENPPVQPCMSEVPEDTLSIKELKKPNKKSKKKVTNIIIDYDS